MIYSTPGFADHLNRPHLCWPVIICAAVMSGALRMPVQCRRTRCISAPREDGPLMVRSEYSRGLVQSTSSRVCCAVGLGGSGRGQPQGAHGALGCLRRSSTRHTRALIASLSAPFGEQVSTELHDVGYRTIRPPDFYCAPWCCSPSATEYATCGRIP